MAQSKIPLLDANGLLIPEVGFPSENIRDIQNMKLKKGDIILVTYPKCGTTWAQYIIWEILNNGAVPPPFDEIMYKIIPFLEMTGVKIVEKLPFPRTMKLHTPRSLTPYSSDALYICVVRNPFDCCISYFNHIKEFDAMFQSANLTFDEFFECFLDGHVPFNDYFEHLLGWYDHRNDSNVLFLYFENMKADPRKTVEDMTKFLGRSLSPPTLENVMKYSSFDYMKTNLQVAIPVSVEDFKHDGPPKGEMKEVNFFRKGQVGGWKEYMNREQQQRLLDQIKERVRSQDLREMLIPSALREN